MPSFRPRALALCFFCLILAFPVYSSEITPRVLLEESEGSTRILVEVEAPDGSAVRHLLRETDRGVRLRAQGGDPGGRAAFVSWAEVGGSRFEAISRDAGQTWTQARPLRETLRLAAGSAALDQPLPRPAAGLFQAGDARVFLVQFETRGLPEWRSAIESLGAEVLQYVPHNAHIVRVAPGALETLRAFSFVARVEPYHPGYRISPEIESWLVEGGSSGEVRRVRVSAFEWGEAGKQRIAGYALGLGARIAALWPSGHVVELWLTREQARALAAHDDVLWMDPWTPSEDDMDLVREDAGTNFIENTLGYCGQGVRGEVMDSGVQQDHPDFDGILLHGSASVASHGTSTYGIVFGNGDRDGDGDPQGTGHMPCAEQGIFADYDSLGDRFAHTQELKGAPYFASFQTNSWGGGRTRAYTSVSQEMDDIIWRLDIAITQSQSNAGNQDSRPQAWAKNIISVGGVRHKNTLTPADDDWSNGGSIGPAADGRIKPDVNYWYDSIFTTTTGSTYTSGFGGTSAATPEVAGVLGLMVQMWSDDVWATEPEGSTVFERQPHASTIKALLVNNAQQYPFSGTGADLTRVHQGWGRPSVEVAFERAPRSFVIDEEVSLVFDEEAQYEVDVEPGEAELKITMVYTDLPGTTSASLHRINDLDLEVTSPSGTVYHGNVGLDAGNYSTPGGAPNGIDNVENVFVENPEDGKWNVRIHAAEINGDQNGATPEIDQNFALVVTGGTGQICDAPIVDFTATPNPGRVGEPVSFDSTVSGGAGGPYVYAWDFDDDGAADSSLEDPTHVYRRPYVGDVQLRVTDVSGCTAKIQKPFSVDGPDLRYAGFSSLLEATGNGNGKLDPGETWELRVEVENTGSETAVGVAADLLVSQPSPGSVTMLSSTSTYGDVAPASAVASASVYSFRIGADFPCGQDITFDLVSIHSSDPVNTYPDEPGVFSLLVGGAGPRTDFLFDGLETNQGWSFQGGGEWQIGVPQGLGSGQSVPGFPDPNPDPTSAFEGSQVLGTDLSGLGPRPGNYEPVIDSTATSPPYDAEDAVEIELSFRRWLNLAQNDVARVEVSGDGSNWRELWNSAGEYVADADWMAESYDVSPEADGNPSVRVRFGLVADGTVELSGWNLDGLTFTGVTKDSCEPFDGGALDPGASDGLVVVKSGGQLQLSWNSDCGGASSYGVYRGDLALGYESLAPEPGLCSVSDTNVLVGEGAGATDFFLVVPNDGAGEGAYGFTHDGSARDAATGSCLPQLAIDACAQ